MSMKRVVMGLVVVLALGLAVPSHAFLFGNCFCNPCGSNVACCACAPYEVKVSYTPIQPQPGECTYCTCLPYGCPDGAPCVTGCPPCAAPAPCAAPCAPCEPCGLNLCGCLCSPCACIAPCISGACGMVGGILDCACNCVSGLLSCCGCCAPCAPCGPAAPMAQ